MVFILFYRLVQFDLSTVISQERDLQKEIHRLNSDLKDRDVIIENRKTEIKNLDFLISESREGFNYQKAQRDKLQDERKYELFCISILNISVIVILF